MSKKYMRLRNDRVLQQAPYNFTKIDGGIYCVSPFNCNKDNYNLFKVGMTTSFLHRMEQYMTINPQGIWYIAFLRPKYGRSETKETLLRRLERLAIAKLMDEPNCIHVKPAVRVQFPSEWFFCKASTIHKVFDEISEDYLDKSIKSNKLILNRLSYRDCVKYDNMEINKKGKHLRNNQVIAVQSWEGWRKDPAIDVAIKFIKEKEKEKRYNLRSGGK